jgi:hypothetical protein
MAKAALPSDEAVVETTTKCQKRPLDEDLWGNWGSTARSGTKKKKKKSLPLNKNNWTLINSKENSEEPEQNKSSSEDKSGCLHPVVDHRKKVADIEDSLNKYEKELLEGVRYPGKGIHRWIGRLSNFYT